MYVQVTVDNVSSAYEIDLYQWGLEPIRSCEDPMLMYLNDEIPPFEAHIQRQLRRDSVNDISIRIAEAIMKQLEKKDTHNGYTKAERTRGL